MIKKIVVNGLFETFNHPITLKKGNLTLILGENGLGKTIILKMIKSFFGQDFIELNKISFTEFILTFDDNAEIEITKGKNNSELIFKYKLKNKKAQVYRLNLEKSGSHGTRSVIRNRSLYYNYEGEMELVFFLQKYLPTRLERIGSNEWFDTSRGVVSSTRELLKYYSHMLPNQILREFENPIAPWLIKRADSLKVKLIETQRLLIKNKNESGEYQSSVLRYSKELVEKIKNITVEATDLASKLDRSYPNRIIAQITKRHVISREVLDLKLKELAKKRILLNRVGLIDTTEDESAPINYRKGKDEEFLKGILDVYINDSNEKLSVYQDLATRINLLLTIINKRFLYKEMSIDKSKGFIFTSKITKSEIPLTGLSSGEQHELVLFFELLFKTEMNSLILIDEPEISLHISWQNHFLNDLNEVFNISNLHAIITTHSPDIINKKWDVTVRLKGK